MSILGQLFVKVQHDEVQETMPLQEIKESGKQYWGEIGYIDFDKTRKQFSNCTPYLPYRKSWIVT